MASRELPVQTCMQSTHNNPNPNTLICSRSYALICSHFQHPNPQPWAREIVCMPAAFKNRQRITPTKAQRTREEEVEGRMGEGETERVLFVCNGARQRNRERPEPRANQCNLLLSSPHIPEYTSTSHT